MREGRCYGGPLDGKVRTIRNPQGFLLGDKPNDLAWFYDWRDGGFHVRDPEPQPLVDALAVELAIGERFDVLALPDSPETETDGSGRGPDVDSDDFTTLAGNPDPGRISAAIWRLWTDFDRIESSALLGGVYAAKPGYHNYRDALPSSDYSVRDVAADRKGSGTKAAALDLSLSDSAMRRYTGRLDAAARSRDPRLYSPRGPVLREFIGTKDNRSVYCYVLVGGRPLGVGADAGPDPGRDSTHLWHIHLSIIRQFCEDWSALDGVLSVLRGESLAAWRARTEDDMAVGDDIYRLLEQGLRPPGTAQTSGGGVPVAWIVREIANIKNEQARAALRDEALLAAVTADDSAEVLARIDTRAADLAAAIAAVPAETVEVLGEIDNPEEIAQRLRGMLGDKATAVGQILARG